MMIKANKRATLNLSKDRYQNNADFRKEVKINKQKFSKKHRLKTLQ